MEIVLQLQSLRIAVCNAAIMCFISAGESAEVDKPAPAEAVFPSGQD